MRGLSVTKIFTFASAHHLPEYIGKCRNVHGHTFRLFVTIALKSDACPEGGMIIDFTEMKEIVDNYIIKIFDHKDLNITITNPTAENIIIWIRDVLEAVLRASKNIYLKKLQLWESDTSFAEWDRSDTFIDFVENKIIKGSGTKYADPSD
jgi:6-pyruvoyltetrahydropterin/6-carboxytetrahydropterin synthase